MLIKKIVEIASEKSRTKNIIKKLEKRNKEGKTFGYILEKEIKKGE